MSIRNEDVARAFKKHPVVFTCGAAVLLFAVGTYLRMDGVSQLESQLAEKTREGERQQFNIRNSALLAEHLEIVEQGTQAVTARAVDPRALADNLQFFYQLESDVGVKLTDVRQGNATPAAKGQTYPSVPYTVAVNGSYLQLVRFLQQLENASPLVRFNAFTLAPRAMLASLPPVRLNWW